MSSITVGSTGSRFEGSSDEWSRLVALVRRWCPARRGDRVDDAADFAHEVMSRALVKAVRVLPAVDGLCSADAYLSSIVRTVRSDLFDEQARRRKRQASLDDGVIAAEHLTDSSPDPEAALLEKERAGLVRAAFERLQREHPRYARVLRMYRLQEMTPAEIAAAEGISRPYVHQIVRRATTHLARCLAEGPARSRGSPVDAANSRPQVSPSRTDRRHAQEDIHEGSDPAGRSRHVPDGAVERRYGGGRHPRLWRRRSDRRGSSRSFMFVY